MCDLSHYIKVSTSPNGCDSYDAEQFKCDRYLDCESCLEDKIIEHDKHIIEQYKENIYLKNKQLMDKVVEELNKLDVKAIKRYKGGTFGDYEGTDYYIKKSEAIEIVKRGGENE